ncbi:uncharacterized protein LOC128740602 [Sabethes cyaneus]|uniref:uncharacterized protein LOC128740602 n=1 Tax=Sabethes cyaneus TaxID=53552 RepID=UPI00237D8158|nr:uncharacterized protein LOC128740602 [Sabethes cyaneus]
MCDLLHSIELVNVSDNDKFLHSLILLKGVIINRCETGQLKVRVDNVDWPASSSVRFINDKKGQFRLLINLKEGKNHVTLVYCEHEVAVNICFERSACPYTIIPLYIICQGHDGSYQSDTVNNDIQNACRKINLGIKLVQSLYAEKLFERGFGRKTFTVGSDCIPFYSSLAVDESRLMTDQELWNYFSKEIIESELLKSEKQKFIAFISSTFYEGISNNDFSYENIKRHTTGHAALGGGGLALFGTGCLYTWPSSLPEIVPAFLNKKKINRASLMDDSNHRHTYGGCYATTIGSVCHELGHIFDLGHTKDGIMGSEFDHVNRVFTLVTNTEALPDRIVGQTNIKESMNRKLTAIKRPGEFLRKYQQQKESDVTYFADNCAIILQHHKWFSFNPCINICDTKLSFNFITRFVTSINSFLKLIELRERKYGMLKIYWSFMDSPTNSFQIMTDIDLSELTLFVIDHVGNILKQDL